MDTASQVTTFFFTVLYIWLGILIQYKNYDFHAVRFFPLLKQRHECNPGPF